MKRLILFIGLLFIVNRLSAQKRVTASERHSGIDEVFVHVKYANTIEIKNWDSNEISVQATVNINNNRQNDYFSLKTDQIGGTYTVTSDYGDFFKEYGNYCYYNYFRDDCDNGDNNGENKCNCNNKLVINYVIYVPDSTALRVKSITESAQIESYTGSLELDFISGNIDIKKHSKNMWLKTISGDIDVYISDAYFEAHTYGGIYSDLDIDFSQNKTRNSSRKIKATIKNGAATLKYS